jgi:murein DD-endopeptidase MepM/ murein hydrolase activator NlpD
MPALLRAARVAVLALAIVAADVAVTLHADAQTVPLAGSGTSSSASPTPSPTPTPCPTDITGTLCQAAGGPAPASPTPTPSPTPAAGGGAKSSPSSAPAAAAGPAKPGGPTPPPGAAAPTPAPSAAAIAQVAATFRNAPFLGQLLDILSHPISAQRPDLRHFRPALAAGGVDDGGPSSPSGRALAAFARQARGSAGPALAVAALGMLLAMLAALLAGSAATRLRLRRGVAAVWSLHPSMHRIGIGLHNLLARLGPVLRAQRRRLGIPHFAVRRQSHRGLALASCVAALPAVLVAAVLGSAEAARDGGALARGTASAPTSAYLRSEVSLDAAPVGQAVAPPTWTRLVTIERGLAGGQDELAAQEAAITRLAVNLAGQQPEDDGPVQVGPASPSQLRNQLGMLIGAHAATQAAYQQSLQAEYDLYRAAAQDPSQRDQLNAAAAAEAVAAKQPAVKDAVSYNLSLIQTQLTQEAQIAAAEGQLAQIGSLGQAQLDAMRHHQPFIAPEIAPVTQTFGPTDFSLEPPLTYNGTFYPHFHTGLDLGAPLDTPLHAAADGVVLLAAASVDSTGKLVGYGNYVVVAHPDGFVTLYGHLDSIAVKAGQVVHQGEIIGQEGSTGWSTGPHVHFEIRHDGQFLDPAPFLAGQLPPG